MPFADKNGLAAKRSKLSRDERARRNLENDGWRWLLRAMRTWLWQESHQPQGARQHNRLTKPQQKIRRRISNRLFYSKNRERLTLDVRLTRKMCPEIREKWESARRNKRAQGRENQ